MPQLESRPAPAQPDSGSGMQACTESVAAQKAARP